MSVNLTIHLDKVALLSLPNDLSGELEKGGMCENDQLLIASFCGVVMLGDRVHVFVPRSSEYKSLSNSEQVSFAAATLRAVEKYGREKNARVDLKDADDGSQGLSKLSLVRNLLDDFRGYGIYSRRRIIRSFNNAKPDWNRTISRSVAMLDKSGRPVYLDIHCTKKKYFTDTEVSAIHAHIIRDLDRKFAWMLTGKSGLIAPELSDYPEPASTSSYQIYILQKELQQTYAERDIRLLKYLIQYLKNESGEQNSHFIAGVRSFHFAWEHMLRNVLSGVIEVNHLLPAPCYISSAGEVLSANEKSMRTDIVLEDLHTGRLSVVDAKYYAASSPNNAPGWGDLVKQFFYAKALKLIKPESTIRNIFVFPGKKSHLFAARVRSRKEVPEQFHDEEFSPVECSYVCPIELVEHYSAGRKMKQLTADLLS